MAAPSAEARVGNGSAAGLRLQPRPARVGGRAIAGAFVIATSAVLVFGAWLGTRPGRGRPWVVAAVPVAAGTRITPADLRTVQAHLTGTLAATAFGSRAEVEGRTLAVALQPGELVTAPELTPAGTQPGLRPVTVTISAPELSGLVAGERVDLFETTGTAPTSKTTVLLRGGEVMAVTGSGGGLLSAGNGTEVLTLGVATLPEVEAVIAAEHAGVLDVVAAEPSDGVGLGAGGTPPARR